MPTESTPRRCKTLRSLTWVAWLPYEVAFALLQEGVRRVVDPHLMVAVARHEASWGISDE